MLVQQKHMFLDELFIRHRVLEDSIHRMEMNAFTPETLSEDEEYQHLKTQYARAEFTLANRMRVIRGLESDIQRI
jgi:uncharacterized protein YdcH (DUF465 family)